MFGLFKKKSEREILLKKYSQLQEEAFHLSKTNRTASDAKTAEAAELMQKIENLPVRSLEKLKIVFTGPESTGKTTLSLWLSKESGIPLVSEMARIYLEPIGFEYAAHHVSEIGLLQHFEENKYKNHYTQIICDTDLLTILIWMEVKFNLMDDYLFDLWLSSEVDLYFLCMPDIPWVEDPLRESPHDRELLSELYKQYLIKYQKPYVEVSGPIIQRQEIIKSQLFEVCGFRF